MSKYPEDIMKAANDAMAGWWLSLEGHETFGTRVPQHLTVCIAKAINAERKRCASIVKSHDTGDMTREDLEARRILAEITEGIGA